jgi:hypothetical protein
VRRVTASAAKSGEIEFWASDPERLGEDDDEWASAASGCGPTFVSRLKLKTAGPVARPSRDTRQQSAAKPPCWLHR